MWKLVASGFLSIAIFVFAGVEIQKTGIVGWQFFCGLLFVGSGFAMYAFKSHGKLRDQQNCSEMVLHELDPRKHYQVLCRTHDIMNHEQVMYLYDCVNHEYRLACIHGSYPPVGFRAVKTPQRTIVLVPVLNSLGTWANPQENLKYEPA